MASGPAPRSAARLFDEREDHLQVLALAEAGGQRVIGAGAGMLPAAGPGAGSALLRLVAAGALIAAAGLVLPYVARRLPFLVTEQ